jgi:hypothetical protein
MVLKNVSIISRFMILVVLIITSCMSNQQEKTYVINYGERDEVFKVSSKDEKPDFYFDLFMKADSLLQTTSELNRIAQYNDFVVERLLEKQFQINGISIKLTSYYLVIDKHHFFWGVNINDAETIYLTNTDGDKELKLISDIKMNRKIIPVKLLHEYINDEFISIPPKPPLSSLEALRNN